MTLNALLCKKTLDSIVKRGSHYIIRVKCNQPCLKSAAGQTVVNSDPTVSHREEKVTGGSPEIRKTYLYNRQNSLDGGWESINPIVYVRREFLRGNREHKSDSLYATSHFPAGNALLAFGYENSAFTSRFVLSFLDNLTHPGIKN